ncbi:MAG: hypothetical protein AAF804_22225 [Bacteroidota bacterium]
MNELGFFLLRKAIDKDSDSHLGLKVSLLDGLTDRILVFEDARSE